MRACHAAGPGSIPDRDKLPGRFFFSGFFLVCKTNVRKLGPHGSPNIIWPRDGIEVNVELYCVIELKL